MARGTKLGLAVCGALALMVAAPAAQADPVADFYRGKTVNVLIGVGVGGEYDIQARLVVAPHRQAHPRQPDHRGAEHDRRRRAEDDQLPLQRRAEGRHHRSA